ncbi:MAG: DUF1232 domain-containing protein [Candidatus Heimdallarchaeota archaeon]|nr:DUF1232 domain-containing protein [Candidatus Heimdallarchaeota archaeon]
MFELFKHPELPRMAKILIISLLGYVFIPIDLIPDFVPFIGDLDDFIVIIIFYKLVKRITPLELIEGVRADVISNSGVSWYKNRRTIIIASLILLAKIAITLLFISFFDINEYLGI